jgi:hypothetical protein
VTSPLSGIAVEKRRQLAATLGLFAMLFLAVGAVAATGASDALMKAFVAGSFVVAVLLALLAWGVLRSVRLDAADRRIDDAIEAAVRAGGGSMCDCGHEHDPDELHFVDGEGQHVTGRRAPAACASDGTGADCEHSCDTCLLAAMRHLEPVAAFARPSQARAGEAAPAGRHAAEGSAGAESAAPGSRPRPRPGRRRPSPR